MWNKILWIWSVIRSTLTKVMYGYVSQEAMQYIEVILPPIICLLFLW